MLVLDLELDRRMGLKPSKPYESNSIDSRLNGSCDQVCWYPKQRFNHDCYSGISRILGSSLLVRNFEPRVEPSRLVAFATRVGKEFSQLVYPTSEGSEPSGKCPNSWLSGFYFVSREIPETAGKLELYPQF